MVLLPALWALKWELQDILLLISTVLAITLSLVLYSHQKDYTKRRRTEKALYRITAEFRAIFKSIPDAVVFTDTKNEIIMVNPAFSDLFGYRPEEVMGKKVQTLFDENPAEPDLNGGHARSEEDLRKPYEIQCLRKNGSFFISETVTTAVDDDQGLPFGTFSIIRNITKRKTAEKALSEAHDKLEIWVNERTRDLVRANEEIKRFAYIVSHDLRAPLVNIKGFSSELRSAFEMLNSKISDTLAQLPEEDKEEISDIMKEEIPEALQFIDASATRMGNLIDSVLKLSRLGRRELHFEGINVRVIIQKILDSLAHQIEQKDIQLNIGPLPRVLADRTSLEQIFSNLLGNAVKYLDPERSGEIEVIGKNHGSETIFHIRDNGRGISEDDLEHIFEPFSRVGNNDVPGEGMGLAYVLRLVRRHGGRIWCNSEPGAGTTISFSLSNTVAQETEPVEA